MNDNSDILDLCRLNIMEENVEKSSAVDRDATLAQIDWRRRQLVTAIANSPPTVAPGVMDRHHADNPPETIRIEEGGE